MTTSSDAGHAPRADPQPPLTWPIVSGAVPQLAVDHIERPESGTGLPDTLAPGDTMILTDGDDGLARALGGLGGTGKTQLAVATVNALWKKQAIDLLVWVPAGSRAAILTSYAHACDQVGAARRADAELAAQHLLEWLADTSRPWMVVLDGLAEPEDIDGLWPRGPAGRTLVTTRRLDPSLRQADRRVEHVGVFTRREALAYLRAGLDGDQRTEALDLVDDLRYLPLGLGHAAAVMANEQISCREYRVRLSERKARLTGPVAQGYPAVVVASWGLALASAQELYPLGIARPALTLTALLGSNGIPGAVLTSKAARGFISGHMDAIDGEDQVRRALHNLASFGLVAVDGNAPERTVQVHSLDQAATLNSLSTEEFTVAARTAANALLDVWPEQDQAEPLLAQALRDCASSLQSISGRLLWESGAHPVLLRAGDSLDAARLTGPAVAYWRQIASKCADMLPPGHPHTLRVRDKLESALVAASMFDDAIEVSKGTLAERERVFGPGDLRTFASRFSLAAAYQAAGRLADAILLYEKSVAEQAWLLGPGHPDTWTPRARLASAYQAAGRFWDAIPLYERTVADAEQIREPGHPDIQAARRGLAEAYQAASLPNEAIKAYERIATDAERSRGSDHPDTLAARGDLAAALLQAGRVKEAIKHSKRNLADRERVLGADHPDTLTAGASLASAYLHTGQLREAITLYERTLAERERSGGPVDLEIATSRASLASAYHSAGRLADAIPLYKRAITDSELLRGSSHPDTITLRGNLAHAYHTIGRPVEAVALLKRTVADCERFLGASHPLTQTMRENYDAIVNQ